MRKIINEKPTKRITFFNQNYPVNHDLDPFPQKLQSYKGGVQSRRNNIFFNQSQQTNIEIEDCGKDYEKITGGQSKVESKTQYVMVDGSLKCRLIQEKPQVKKETQEVSKANSLQIQKSCEKDKASLSLEIEDDMILDKERKKKKVYNRRPETLQRQLMKTEEKLRSSNYPQNVMRRIYPANSKNQPKQLNATQKLSKKPQIQSTQEDKSTKKTVKLTQIQKPKLPPSQQKTSTDTIIEVQEPLKQNPKTSKYLWDIRPYKSFEKVDWSPKQQEVIISNIQWLSRVTGRQQIQRRYGQKGIMQEDENTLQEAEIATQKLLELKCMLRYRSIADILIQLSSIGKEFSNHGDQLIDFQRCYRPRIPQDGEFQLQEGINQENFKMQVIESFMKILLAFVLQYPYSSKQNKEFLKQTFEKKGNVIDYFKNSSGEWMIQWDSQDEKEKQILRMLQKQKVFQPHKSKISIKKERVLYSRENKKRELQEQQNLKNRNKSEVSSEIKEKVQPLDEKDFEIDGEFKQRKVQFKSIQIDGEFKPQKSLHDDFGI